VKDHPVHQIISGLSVEQDKLFFNKLIKHSRSDKIYITIRDWPELSKEKIFKKVFKTDYNKQRDYLLRNELSLLRKKLEKFLVEQYQEREEDIQQAQQDYILAKIYLDLQLFNLSEEKLYKSKKTALLHEDWSLLVKLNLIHSSLTVLNTVELEERINRLKHHVEDHKVYASNFYFSETAYAGFMDGMTTKLKKMHGGYKEKSVGMDPLREDPTRMEAYFFFKGIAYGKGGVESVPYLEVALTYLETLPPSPDRIGEWFSCIGQIASEYSAAGNLVLAEKWFDRIIGSAQLQKYAKKNFLLLNYSITLVKLTKYKEALKWIGILEKTSQEQYVLERIKMLSISCYLFTKDIRNLKRVLPRDFSNMDADIRYYYRMQYSIYFYLKGDIESAEREIINLQRNSNVQIQIYTSLISLFLAFYSFMVEFPNGKATGIKRSRLDAFFLEFEARETDEVKNLVPALWLVEEWKNLINRN